MYPLEQLVNTLEQIMEKTTIDVSFFASLKGIIASLKKGNLAINQKFNTLSQERHDLKEELSTTLSNYKYELKGCFDMESRMDHQLEEAKEVLKGLLEWIDNGKDDMDDLSNLDDLKSQARALLEDNFEVKTESKILITKTEKIISVKLVKAITLLEQIRCFKVFNEKHFDSTLIDEVNKLCDNSD